MTKKRDNEIRAYLNILEAAWRIHPELRLGQLITSASGEIDSFYIEDDVLMQGLEEL